ncbi:dTDP-glucose 4,6-dehydratase [Helicovermis profundi]|uniref:dTDP-glucose 4,6-dehydratase n=1 Tax=Helicovermis profundi TaxID=3065157 RepID=A0AAU9EPZ6_9FIRM|nr:dTDP-glucose 4,6-dehydratase [Clostridia bacterium S502]
MKTILVTGGLGFVGSNFIKYILKKYKNYIIVNIDKITYSGNLEYLKDVEKESRYYFEKGDIADMSFILSVFKKYDIDYIINIAAETHVDRSIEDSNPFVRTNIVGTSILLDVAKKEWQINTDNHGYPIYKDNVRFIQISTDEVYGSYTDEEIFTEKTNLLATNPYAASKASADLMVISYGKTFKLPFNITRCANNYGKYQFPEKLIPLVIKKCINNEEIPLYGDGKQIREWIHVLDHVRAIDVILHDGILFEIYNITTNEEKQNIDVVKKIIDIVGKDYSLIKNVEDRLSHDVKYSINADKLKNTLNWSPIYNFDVELENVVNWYLENSWIFE